MPLRIVICLSVLPPRSARLFHISRYAKFFFFFWPALLLFHINVCLVWDNSITKPSAEIKQTMAGRLSNDQNARPNEIEVNENGISTHTHTHSGARWIASKSNKLISKPNSQQHTSICNDAIEQQTAPSDIVRIALAVCWHRSDESGGEISQDDGLKCSNGNDSSTNDLWNRSRLAFSIGRSNQKGVQHTEEISKSWVVCIV